jgi:hypothetical protein
MKDLIFKGEFYEFRELLAKEKEIKGEWFFSDDMKNNLFIYGDPNLLSRLELRFKEDGLISINSFNCDYDFYLSFIKKVKKICDYYNSKFPKPTDPIGTKTVLREYPLKEAIKICDEPVTTPSETEEHGIGDFTHKIAANPTEKTLHVKVYNIYELINEALSNITSSEIDLSQNYDVNLREAPQKLTDELDESDYKLDYEDYMEEAKLALNKALIILANSEELKE